MQDLLERKINLSPHEDDGFTLGELTRRDELDVYNAKPNFTTLGAERRMVAVTTYSPTEYLSLSKVEPEIRKKPKFRIPSEIAEVILTGLPLGYPNTYNLPEISVDETSPFHESLTRRQRRTEEREIASHDRRFHVLASNAILRTLHWASDHKIDFKKSNPAS